MGSIEAKIAANRWAMDLNHLLFSVEALS